MIYGWFEDGAPLGLTLEMFGRILGVQGQVAEVFFRTFDTDRNQKVDAFEVLTAIIILSHGSIEEKLESIFLVIDFEGSGQLNFDEVNILIHSIYRGLRKVCGTAAVDDNEIIEVCRRLFDSHNLPYDRRVTKEQIRRWLRSDAEASSFIDLFHAALPLPIVEAALTEREQALSKIFSQLCERLGAPEVPARQLCLSEPFKAALGSPPEPSLRQLVEAIAQGSQVGSEAFAKGTRAWIVFGAVDMLGQGELDVKELPNLARLQLQKSSIEPKEVDYFHKSLGSETGTCFSRSAWVAVCSR